MNFLFIHGNYPAQFRHLAAAIGSESEHRVVFLTARADAEREQMAGIQIRKYQCHRNVSSNTHHYLQASEDAVLQGQAVLREVARLIEEGFVADIVIAHAGMGLGIFIKDILPESLLIGYFEWYFRKETSCHLVESFDLDTQLKAGLRNIPILQELESCDIGVVPTDWQKQQFPKAYKHKLATIFDGIDRGYFHPVAGELDLTKDIVIRNRESGESVTLIGSNRILTYATRGMEPLRGFPEFMKTLPALLQSDPDLQVVVAGADRRAYSYDAPSHKGSWKAHMLDELGNFTGRDRVFFSGLLTYNDYRNLLWRSNLHCYLTRPYVTSWSLFEAAACGANLAVSRGQATAGIVEEESVLWVDLDDIETLTNSLERGLSNPRRSAKIKEGYDLGTSIQKWGSLINEVVTQKRKR